MNLKKTKYVINSLIVLTFVFLAIGVSTNQQIFLGLTTILLAAMLYVMVMFWRCPHCGEHLGRIDNAKFCKHCGKELDEE